MANSALVLQLFMDATAACFCCCWFAVEIVPGVSLTACLLAGGVELKVLAVSAVNKKEASSLTRQNGDRCRRLWLRFWPREKFRPSEASCTRGASRQGSATVRPWALKW